MLRAISEIARATIVWSVLEKPIAAASSRPFCRAVTMSVSRSMVTTRGSIDTAIAPLDGAAHVREALFEIQGRRHAVEREPELHHGQGDLRLDTDHDGLRAAEFGRVRDRAERARGE